ncbi:hypothetical protein RUM43_003734 [Polyplax serrata]|uniref:Tetratricopeptide repeat protein 21B n=1 Tax=Polyplax serrata TaxID=468196 RepID=A0AAN8Q1P0_POLSC
MNSDKDLKYMIHYYCREKYYQTAENLAIEGIKTYPDEYSFKLYSCFALVLSGRYQESIRDLESLISLKNINVGALLALIAAHKLLQPVDKETVAQLDNKLKTDRKTATAQALYYGALFLFFSRKLSKSIEYLQKVLKISPDFTEALVLKGWLEVSSNRTPNFDEALQCFNSALGSEKRNLDASLGLVKLKEKENDITGAMTLLNQLVVKYPNCLLPLIEKMKIQLVSSDWEQALEIANRILSHDSNCIEGHKIKTLAFMCKDGNFDEATLSLKQLYNAIGKLEKKNGRIYCENAQLFSYLSGKNLKILQETYLFAEKAAQLEPSNPDFLTELGYQNLMQGNIKEAFKFFKSATKLDESSISGLTGLTLCQIEEGGVSEQIKQQVEFLREIQSEQPRAELLLMSAKLTDSKQEVMSFLNQAVKIHFDNFKKYPFGVSYLYHMNPGFLMQIVKEYLRYVPSGFTDYSLTGKVPEAFSKSTMILQEITNSCPGLIEAHYEYAHVQFLIGNFKKAKQVLTHIIDDLDGTSVDAHILMAQIHFQERSYQLGAQSLEVGLSYNFKIQEHPMYHIISAMVQKENGNLVDCINSLKSALPATGAMKESDLLLSPNMKVNLYLELVEAYQQNNQLNEASNMLETAFEEFKGTSEEGKIIIARANMLINEGKITEGIECLQKIQPSENYYPLAKQTMGNVYLINKKDREMFAQCYKDLVENCPNAATYSLLGDAYMSIQEANQAIQAYELALKTNQKDVKLIRKLGTALTKTHYFSKAINYYKEAVKNEGNLDLIYDLAELYFKLGQLDNAERVLVSELENEKNESLDQNNLIAKAKLLRLLAKVRDKSGNLTESLSALKAAKENYSTVDKRIFAQSAEHKDTLAAIYSDMAILLTRLRDFNGAIRCYKESLTAKPGDSKILVAMCRLYMQINDLDECQATCKRLLAAEPDSEPAVIMLADLAFRKVDFETAAYHYKQLLNKKPMYWTALARMIEVTRRKGNLDEVIPFLETAESCLLQPTQDAGYSYCKGLYERYSERPEVALHHFNRARRHNEWGQKALLNMIEICLNPENETLRSEAFTDEMDKEEVQDSREMALRTAHRLLSELHAHPGSYDAFNHRLLNNFWLLATNQKSNIEKAQQDLALMVIPDIYKDHVGIALATATGYVLQKQSQKAKNQLKRIIKNEWTYEDAEYLEKSWLLLTDIYIQAGKVDVPVDLIQRVLQHNKSCYKAYDYAGLIAEKEQLHKDAAVQYEKAWRYCGQTNPAIGYKLAFNYLKGKRYADAIEVCYAILKLYPDYPRIQKEILEKAKTNLRT